MCTLRDRGNSGEEPSGKYYVLNADIDLTSYTDWDDCNFSGHFDGQNHTIRMNSEQNDLYAGLFRNVNSGVGTIAIRNLNLTGTIIADCAGTIVHYLNSGTVDNCTFTGTITPSSSGGSYGAGGIVAHLEGGTITNCRVNANITGNTYAGGIAGKVLSGTIEGCTVEDTTRLTARQVGGIAGDIESSYGVNISSTSNKWPSLYPLSGNDYTPTPTVPEESTEWNNHRYQLITESLTWDEARARCESLGGHLVTITTQQEQNVVASLLASNGGTYWLGAKADSSGWWQWITGEAFERQYQNYADGQPNGSGGFLVMQSGEKWDDVRGDEDSAGFICEWDNETSEVKAAPVASNFSEWMANPALRANSDGAAPSPVNRSHLMNNLPRIAASSAFRVAETLPVSYDARRAIGLPNVRAQGEFNTCWAFASIGALEANYRKQGLTVLGEYPDLSELHLAWFTYKTIYSNDIDKSELILNQAGDPEKAANFLTTFKTAPVSEDDMPYSAAGQSDADVEAFLTGRTITKAPIMLARTISVGQIGEENIDEVKSLIRDYGAVYFHYYDNENAYNEEHRSYYYTNTGEIATPHAALLVGWDDNYPKENFTNAPASNGAWLVRNSWGSDWGDGGYFWMSYEQGTQSNMEQVYVFIVSEDVRDETTEQKKHDEGGETKNIAPEWSANIFQARRDERIIRVTLNTTDNNTDYLLFVNNLGKTKPSNPGSVIGEPVLFGFIPYAGFHTLTLPTAIDVYSGDHYSVIVKMKTMYEYPTAAEGTVEGYFTASVNRGESYFASGDEVPSVWIDGTNVSGDALNATVRVITTARDSDVVKPTITTRSLPAGQTGEAYTFRLEASGTVPVEWRTGELPRGFLLSREGVLSGRSDEAVEADVRITAFNAAGSDEAVLRLSIEGEAPTSPDVPGEGVDVTLGSSNGGCNSGLDASGVVLGLLLLLLRRR